MKSRLPGFYRLSPEDRLARIKELAQLSSGEAEKLRAGLTVEEANRMIENVVGLAGIPMGIATNFVVNGKEYLIPMAIEEPSIVAAASSAAKMARPSGGFSASADAPIMIAQIQLVEVENLDDARRSILAKKEEILEVANRQDPALVSLGGGAKDLRTKILRTRRGSMLIVELLIDCRDAMGANIANRMAEAIAPLLEDAGGGRALLRIVSNLATERLARAEVKVLKEVLGGEEVVERILDAHAFAVADPYRAVTHNKGIMNGIVAVLLATGNDTRAVEAASHAYAARSGSYSPLTTWGKDQDGNLIGRIELPLAVGIVGGATGNPVARVALKILGVKSSQEFAEVLAAVGLAQNLAALRALVTEGITRGHMRLHAKNLAMMVGARGDLIDKIAEIMIEEDNVSYQRAKELLEWLTA